MKSLFEPRALQLDPRAILLALVLSVAAALPWITNSVNRRDYYFFDITLTSTSPGTTQFFWDLGNGFTEYDSSRQPIKIEPNPVVYRFMMPMGEFRAFRFDPIDGIGRFTFSHAQIVDLEGHVVRRFGPPDLLPAANILYANQQGPELLVETNPASNDPIINLRLESPLVLGSTPKIWWELGWPIALPVFLAGCFLGLPAVARRLSRIAGALATAGRSRPASTIIAVAVAAVALQCYPVLFLGRSFASPNNGGHMLYEGWPTLPGDTDRMCSNTGSSDTGALLFQHLYYPMVQRDALLQGELPLWNRYSLSGEPLLGQGQSMFGDPFNFLTIAADGAAWAWDVRFLLARFILAATLGGIVWQLTRHLGAAVLTTIGAAFLGFFTYRLTHPANFSVCYSPLILLAWTGLLSAASPRRIMTWLLALVGANWLVLTSGTVKEAYMLIVCLNFAGTVLLFRQPETVGRRGFLLGLASAAGLGFVLLAAPAWLSFLSAWHHSMTGYDTPHAYTLPWSHFIGFFDDIFYRQTQKGENVVAPALNFIFLLGFLWWMVQPRLWRSDRAAGALLLAAVPPLALAFGLIPPAMIEKIPFVGNIGHVGNTFSCALLTLFTVLAGFGFRDAWEKLSAPAAGGIIIRLWLAGLALAALYFFTTTQFPKSPFFTGYAAALGLVALLLPLGLHWGLTRPQAPGSLWVVLALGLPLLCWRHAQYGASHFDRYTFVPGPRSNLHAPSPAVAIINADRTQPGRVVGWGSSLYASYNTVLRWEGLYGVDAVRSRYYHDLADALGLQRVWDWDWPNRETDSRALITKYDLYNTTHYVATHQEGAHDIAGLKQLGQADLDVYASPTAWPRAFFCDRVVGYNSPNDFAHLLLTGDGRPFAAIQKGESLPLPTATATAGRIIRPARDYLFTANRTSFVVEAPAPGIAVLAETYYLDDFQVTVNGQPASYFRVNHAFRGIALPAAGTYAITYSYWPQYFTLSLWLCFAGALGLGLGALWLWRRPNQPATGLTSA